MCVLWIVESDVDILCDGMRFEVTLEWELCFLCMSVANNGKKTLFVEKMPHSQTLSVYVVSFLPHNTRKFSGRVKCGGIASCIYWPAALLGAILLTLLC